MLLNLKSFAYKTKNLPNLFLFSIFRFLALLDSSLVIPPFHVFSTFLEVKLTYRIENTLSKIKYSLKNFSILSEVMIRSPQQVDGRWISCGHNQLLNMFLHRLGRNQTLSYNINIVNFAPVSTSHGSLMRILVYSPMSFHSLCSEDLYP